MGVSCRDPGFIATASHDNVVINQGNTQENADPNPEVRSGHKPVGSDVGLLSKDAVKSTPATDSSYIATTPAMMSPREPNSTPMDSEGPAIPIDEDGPINASIFGANPLHSERESVSYEGEIVEQTEQAEHPSDPLPMPAKSDEKRINCEWRFCVICKMEQPLRAKHCKTCNRCVALHDHHCPWLGVCVAERNRFRFYWYLVLESSLLWYSLFPVRSTQTITGLQTEPEFFPWLQTNCTVLFCTGTEVLFALMVTSLLGFHTYLASVNVTTWERLSWEKISYLKDWPRSFGSPFSVGCRGNLHKYCCAPLPALYTVWVLPAVLPDKPPRSCCV